MTSTLPPSCIRSSRATIGVSRLSGIYCSRCRCRDPLTGNPRRPVACGLGPLSSLGRRANDARPTHLASDAVPCPIVHKAHLAYHHAPTTILTNTTTCLTSASSEALMPHVRSMSPEAAVCHIHDPTSSCSPSAAHHHVSTRSLSLVHSTTRQAAEVSS